MRVMSLFAGIGGFDLAAEHMGWETAVQVEVDTWCQEVLAKNFPNAFRYGDIKTFDGTVYNGSIDLVCGGFPCQPYSVAGQRKGDQDDRHLWPEMRRVIREVAPRWVVGENVRGLLSWNEGMVFEQVCADLEAIGYEVESFIIPACGVDAPHRRDRLWVVAYRSDAGVEGVQFRGENSLYESGNVADAEGGGRQWHRGTEGLNGQTNYPSVWADLSGQFTGHGGQWIASDPSRAGRQELDAAKISKGSGLGAGGDTSHWSSWPTQSPVCAGDDGLPSGLVRPAQWRNNTIKAAGNAVVWQVVYQIFKAIEQVESQIIHP